MPPHRRPLQKSCTPAAQLDRFVMTATRGKCNIALGNDVSHLTTTPSHHIPTKAHPSYHHHSAAVHKKQQKEKRCNTKSAGRKTGRQRQRDRETERQRDNKDGRKRTRKRKRTRDRE